MLAVILTKVKYNKVHSYAKREKEYIKHAQ